MAKGYVVEWGNGNTDVFATEEEARAAYADIANPNDDPDLGMPDGQVMDLDDNHIAADGTFSTTWSDAAKALLQ